MNDDRCHHIPCSPGQTMCTCTSRRVFLENLVRLQAQRICELEAALYKPHPRLITIKENP